MAYPTSSGSEILFRGAIENQTNDMTAFRWDQTNPTMGTETYTVPALHIITVLSITFCEVSSSGTNEVFQLLTEDGAGNEFYILRNQALNGNETFVFSDRLVLVGGDKLLVSCVDSGANVDVYYSFIDQDWS